MRSVVWGDSCLKRMRPPHYSSKDSRNSAAPESSVAWKPLRVDVRRDDGMRQCSTQRVLSREGGQTRPAPSSRRRRSSGSVAGPATNQRGFYVRMSRSRKKTPVGSILVCGRTEKEDKKIWHQKLRTCDRGRLNDLVRKHKQGDVEELFGNFLPTLPRRRERSVAYAEGMARPVDARSFRY